MNQTPDVKDFFTKEDPDLLTDPENLTELHRRVTVFHDALGKFEPLHEIFTDIAKNTPYQAKGKHEYIRDGARAYIGELLYQDAEKLIPTTYELNKVHNRLQEILSVSLDQKYWGVIQEIEEMLFDMLGKAYPNEVVDSNLLHAEVKNLQIIEGLVDIAVSSITTIDERYDIGDIHEIDQLIFDLEQIRDTYIDVFYTHYLPAEASIKDTEFDHYAGDIERFGSRNISKQELFDIVSGIVEAMHLYKSIHESFELLHSEIQSIDINNPDLVKIQKIEEGFKDHINKYSLQKKYVLRRSRNKEYNREKEDKKEITVAEVRSNTEYQKIEDMVNASSSSVYRLGIVDLKPERIEKTVEMYYIIKNLITFDKVMGQANYKRISTDKARYGAKGAYLNQVNNFIKKLPKYTALRLLHCEIICPQYALIDIKYYKERLKSGEINTTYFKEVFDSFNGERLIVRSSAVNSEDNEHLTGAGVYHSEICKDQSFSSFCKAVVKVYESCNSDIAISYREKNNIHEEYMGLVVQKYIDDQMRWNGQVNTIVPFRPDLLEVSGTKNAPDGFRPIFNKEELSKEIFRGYFGNGLYANKKLYYFQIDRHKHDGEIHDGFNAAKLATLLERYFRKPLQVEFVAQSDGASIMRKIKINAVQARTLPEFLNVRKEFEFPKEGILLRRGRALGACDETYEVLGTGHDNSDKIGVVSFGGNHQASMSEDFIRRSLPRKGAVIIRNKTGEYGHIETICIEENIPCLFDNSEYRYITREAIELYDEEGGHTSSVRSRFSNLYGFKKVRVVVNGLEGRVYGIEKDSN